MRRRLGIPTFASVKQLASALRLPATRVLQDLTVNARKRVFAKYGSVWHEFKSAREVIVPFRVSAAYAAWLASKGHCAVVEVEVEEEDYSTAYDLYQASSVAAAAAAAAPTTTTSTQESVSQGLPVVVLLGHCDHGKTTLLQALSDQRHFLESEGPDGMTQTVRTVYAQVSPAHPLTLVDTPGQDLFYRMRNYGAAVADAFLLVIAADEGVQQQTMESIGIIQGHLEKHSGAGAQGRPTSRVIVAINKIDKLTPPLPPEASQEQILGHQQLRPLLEELRAYVALEGASLVGISALTGSNLDTLRRLLMLRRDGVDIDCSSDSQPTQVVGVGSILNIEQNTRAGIQLHVLLLKGSVAPGAFFCAGGWSGTVRAISAPHRFGPSSLSTLVTAGMGVKMTVSLDSSCHEPLPLGNQALFLPTSRTLSAPPESTSAKAAFPLASLVGLPAREAAQIIAEQARLGHKLPLLRLSADVAASYRLPNPRFQDSKNAGQGRPERSAAAVTEQEVGEEEEEEEEKEEEEEERENSDQGRQNTRRIVLKVDSHVTLETVMDALDDAAQEQEQEQTQPDAVKVTLKTEAGVAIIIRRGAGDVTPTDAMVARLAGAEIVMYNVKVLSGASVKTKGKNKGRSKEPSVPLRTFTRIPDIVDHILGFSNSRTTVE